MKKVSIIGIGTGAKTLTREASEAIEHAEVLLGAPRMLSVCNGFSGRSSPYYMPEQVAEIIAEESAQSFVILVSGDVGFYSAASDYNTALAAYDLRFIPGVSTVNAFFARLRRPWQEAAFVSAHGRKPNVADTVRRNRLTFCLTGNNASELGSEMCSAGFGHIPTYAGENLGANNERVYEITAEVLVSGGLPPLTVLLFENEAFDSRTPCGLPDGSFTRLEGVPMTKSETRALVMSKLNLCPTDICWDVGAGSGSVTVEMALSAYHGHVYAVERCTEAAPLIQQNCAAFHIGNVTVIQGEAPEALESLPAPDAVFIGGSRGELPAIFNVILRNNPHVRIVLTAVTIETVSSALDAFSKAGLKPEITQISAARAKPVGGLHMMEAQNPVTILSGGNAIEG